MNIKIESLENLIHWKKSWRNIWSRKVPHHLFKYEMQKYEIATKKWYLVVNHKDRENLLNIWDKYCKIKNIKNIICVKNFDLLTFSILVDNKEVYKWLLKDLDLNNILNSYASNSSL